MAGFEANTGQAAPAVAGAGAGAVGAVGSVVGGMLSKQAVDSATAEVQKLVDSAKSGGFAISDEGADEYIRVFRDFERTLTDLQRTVTDAGQAPSLGTSDYASQVATHTQLIASGDAQSYETALASLTTVVQQARAAFEQAKKNYAQMDDEAVQTFSGTQV
ncbi:MAG TPA: hypothetical protein VHC18_00280 [Amycolatopsis sp.]|nr:hypothetical protein [Amycolatopsis sp.]